MVETLWVLLMQGKEEAMRKAYEADQLKPLPPVEVDMGGGQTNKVAVVDILIDVAKVLGKDPSGWKDAVSKRRGGGRKFRDGPKADRWVIGSC